VALYVKHESWEDNISEGAQWVKINIDRKRSLYNEKTVFKNYRPISAQVIAQLYIHLEDPVSTKTVLCELHKSKTMADCNC
jgi:hypothetical protein